jgi:hypothetical protein
MSYQDHYRTCPYCNKGLVSTKPTIRVKSAASSCEKEKKRKLSELAALITGRSYGIPTTETKTKAASRIRIQGIIEKRMKLAKLGKMIRGF